MKKQKLKITTSSFELDGKPFYLASGDIHYFRIHPSGWKRRLELMKDFGLNTVETYVAWSCHEPKEGQFCFEGMYDLAAFLDLCAEMGFYVLLRPTPYICAEFDLGGVPSWLLKDRSITLRCNDERWLAPIRRYYKVLFDIVRPYADIISKAINENKQISFSYYSLDENKQRVYHKDGKRYIVNPLVIVWNKDNYYLMSYHDNHDGITNYRIDRMDSVKLENTERTERAEYQSFDVEKYRRQVFSMFGGELCEVELTFTSDMINDIYDKFGEDLSISKHGDVYQCITPIQVSKTFFSWVAGTCGKVEIVSPNEVKDNFESFVKNIAQAYIK